MQKIYTASFAGAIVFKGIFSWEFWVSSFCDMEISLVLLLLFLPIHLAIAHSTKDQCVSSFRSAQYRSRFDICLTTNCFIFRKELPFIGLDDTMKSPEAEMPFLCSEYLKQFSRRLKGIFFLMLMEMQPSEGSYCVWAGNQCSYDGVLNFISSSAEAGDTHRWIAGGLFFVLPYRFSPYTIPSTSIIEDKFRVIGPPVEGYTTPSQAAKTIVKPFTAKAWGFIVGCICLHLVIKVFLVSDYVYAVSPHQGFDLRLFRERFFSIRNDHNQHPANEEAEEVYRNRHSFWMLIATMFIAITLIFWELAIAVQVYEARLEAPFDDSRPERFVIVENTTEEFLFKQLIGNNSGWKRVKTIPKTYEAISRTDNSIDSTVVYELFHRYEMKQNPSRCEKLRLYPGVPSTLVENQRAPELTGAWYYSRNLPISNRIEIDKSLARLKANGRILKIVEDFTGKELADDCLLKTQRIDWVLLGLLHIIITGIPSTVLIFWIIFGWVRIIARRRRRAIRDQDESDSAETLGSSTSINRNLNYRSKASSSDFTTTSSGNRGNSNLNNC